MKRIGVGLLGCGVVGSAVLRNITAHAGAISARCDAEFEVRKIAVRDRSKKRANAPSAPYASIDEVVDDPSIDIVVELMGGEDEAYRAIKRAIANRKHVVTANKLLLARRGEEIFSDAIAGGVEIGFEASVAGAVPVIRTLKEAVASGAVRSITGIINGTSNYILTNMREGGVSFTEALREAQKLGYAEADPAFDVEGTDAAHKVAILASLAYGSPVDFNKVHTEGISRLMPDDFDFARQFGRVIKLLAIARLDSGSLDVRVHPAMVPLSHPIAGVNGVTNAVEIKVSDAGRLLLIGPGAGGDATASAVIANMADIARDMIMNTVGRISPFGFMHHARRTLPMKPVDEIKSGYYIRLTVDDRPGVLAKMAGILGDNGISIDSVIQKGRSGGAVPLVLLTHEAGERAVRDAVKKFDGLGSTREKAVIIRLEDGE